MRIKLMLQIFQGPNWCLTILSRTKLMSQIFPESNWCPTTLSKTNLEFYSSFFTLKRNYYYLLLYFFHSKIERIQDLLNYLSKFPKLRWKSKKDSEESFSGRLFLAPLKLSNTKTPRPSLSIPSISLPPNLPVLHPNNLINCGKG